MTTANRREGIMERNVVTLETAKKLKTAGFPQDTYAHWFWTRTEQTFDWKNYLILDKYSELDEGEELNAAPTAQEIADQLPRDWHDGWLYAMPLAMSPKSGWVAGYEDSSTDDSPTIIECHGDTMAEALAVLWLKIHEGKNEPRD